ncbi:hypothetical protein RJT34_33075 [Clitoria ternatea]|uniref:Uncharacterized protein n=1 Tax=Clitoria ternatea TaxID=43366 RepID=A0AAN9F1D7_CLITE
MKILNWMQKRLKKLGGSKEKKKPNSSLSATLNGTQTLIVIGTIGNNNLNRIDATAGDSCSSQDCALEFTLENLPNEFNIYFPEQVQSNRVTEQSKYTLDHINQHLNSPRSNLEVEGKENETFSDGSNPSNHSLDNSKSGIGKKALVFFLKMFICTSGFQPCFKDPLSTESRMDKILGEILSKKINLHGSNSAISIKKYMENRLMLKSDNGEEEQTTDDADIGSKWRTDSKYITLDI